MIFFGIKAPRKADHCVISLTLILYVLVMHLEDKRSKMSGKQVSQATFDAIVREAIDDFGLSESEALEDAKAQLKAAGVTDFSNVITSAPASAAESHPGVRFVNDLRNASNSLDKVAIVKSFASLDITVEVVGVAGSNGAVELLSGILLDTIETRSENVFLVLTIVCSVIATLCARNELNRMRFVKSTQDGVALLGRSIDIVCSALQNTSDTEETAQKCSAAVQILRAVRAVQRSSEPVKCRFAAGESPTQLLTILDSCGHMILSMNQSNDVSIEVARNCERVIQGVCAAVRQMLLADDNTSEFPETFNRARMFAGESSVMDSGLKPLQCDRTFPEIALDVISEYFDNGGSGAMIAECISAVRLCAVSDEICKTLMDMGYGDVCKNILRSESSDAAVIRAVISLLRNLSGRDQCKSKLAQLIDHVVHAVNEHSANDELLSEHFCGLVAGLCLRRPDVAKTFAKSGVLDCVVKMMKIHGNKANVQRAGCLALRNTGSRDESARDRVGAIVGVEAVIRAAQTNFVMECDSVAYDALRELDFLADKEMRYDKRYKVPGLN